MFSRRSVSPSKELVAFAERQARKEQIHPAIERRSEPRQSIVRPVVAQPVNENLEAVGPPFALVTQDMSSRGFGLVSEEFIHHKWLRLKLTVAREKVDVVVRVLWCRAHGPFHLLGGEVVAKANARIATAGHGVPRSKTLSHLRHSWAASSCSGRRGDMSSDE